jgi:hypothetical protein
MLNEVKHFIPLWTRPFTAFRVTLWCVFQHPHVKGIRRWRKSDPRLVAEIIENRRLCNRIEMLISREECNASAQPCVLRSSRSGATIARVRVPSVRFSLRAEGSNMRELHVRHPRSVRCLVNPVPRAAPLAAIVNSFIRAKLLGPRQVWGTARYLPSPHARKASTVRALQRGERLRRAAERPALAWAGLRSVPSSFRRDLGVRGNLRRHSLLAPNPTYAPSRPLSYLGEKLGTKTDKARAHFLSASVATSGKRSPCSPASTTIPRSSSPEGWVNSGSSELDVSSRRRT